MSSAFISYPVTSVWALQCAGCDRLKSYSQRDPKSPVVKHTRVREVVMTGHENPSPGFPGDSEHDSARRSKDESISGSKNPPWSKFDPNSSKDAFGRDPRKETEFWMEGAREVLESDIVVEALAEYKPDAADGLTDEQRAYMEFANSIKIDSSKNESVGEHVQGGDMKPADVTKGDGEIAGIDDDMARN